jgi:Kef-type K+ transport system membrane component KefB
MNPFSRKPSRAARRARLVVVLILAALMLASPLLAQGDAALTHTIEATGTDSHDGVKAYVPLMLGIAIVLLASRIGGSVARRLGQPRVLGQLLIGILIGPTLLDLIHLPVFHNYDIGATLNELAELGVLLLMFTIGLEVHVAELLKVGRVAIVAGISGAVVPVVLAGALLVLAGFSWQPALFAGVTLAATSVSISAQVLLELGYLRTRVGNGLLATALVDDVLAILLLALVQALILSSGAGTEGLAGLVTILLRMVVFGVVAGLIGWFVLPRAIDRLARYPYINQTYGIPIMALMAALLFGWAAEELGGMAHITGAFIAGVGLSQMKDAAGRGQIQDAMTNLAYVFLIPIFFINVGLQTDLSAFPPAALPLMLTLLAVAVISKFAGAGLGAWFGGFSRTESAQLGTCMISRGEVGLIIASVGLSSGVFGSAFDPDGALYLSLFMVIILTTLITPPLVRWLFARTRGEASLLTATGTQGE